MKSFTITNKNLDDKSIAIIEGEVSTDAINAEQPATIKSFQSRINVDGFRKGHVPEKIIIERIGELSIYEESASRLIEKNYPEIIKEAEVDAIGFPKVAITKISVGSPASFKVETAVMPSIKLADYKNISKSSSQGSDGSKKEIDATDEDVDKALEDMRRSLAHHQKHHNPENKITEDDPQHESHDDHTGKDIPEEELPELNDEFAKIIGGFESLDILKGKIKESITNEKKIKAREKNRLKIMEQIIEKSDINLPQILVDNEVSRMISEFGSNLENMGIRLEDYLKEIKKSIDDFKVEWKAEAEKRAKIQLILKKISEEEKLSVDEEKIKKESEAILNQYKDADKSVVDSYVRNVLLNERVWQFLEEQNS